MTMVWGDEERRGHPFPHNPFSTCNHSCRGLRLDSRLDRNFPARRAAGQYLALPLIPAVPGTCVDPHIYVRLYGITVNPATGTRP